MRTQPLVVIDRIADYVPFISTVSNLVNLFHKIVVRGPGLSENVHYYRYLDQKSIGRCVILLVPGLGNIAVSIYDFAKELLKDKQVALVMVGVNGLLLEHMSPVLKNDLDVVLRAVRSNPYSFQYASEEIRHSKNSVLEAAKIDGLVLCFASHHLCMDNEVVSAALESNGLSLEYVHSKFKSDVSLVVKAVRQNGFALAFADRLLQENRDVLQVCWKQISTLSKSRI